MRFPSLILSFVLFAGVLVAGPSEALSKPRHIGTFSEWSAFVDGSGDSQECYIISLPKKEEGKYTRRDDTYIVVTHRKKDKTFGQVSVEAGYTYKRGSEVDVDIDGKGSKLFTTYRDGSETRVGSNAWAYVGGDAELVAAMKAGAKMVVKGTSSRGTLTTDTYSLSGFTAAYKAISKACGVK
jgi:invasion protein IalB